MAIDGPSGSGKTYTALRFAFALAGPSGRVAVIDTESDSASLYVGEAPDGIPWQWQGVSLKHFAPSTYELTVQEAGRLGADVLVIDSLSHAWMGAGGALAQVDKAAATEKLGSFAGWREVTPQHEAMVRAIMDAPLHVIATLRSKMGYEVETGPDGKARVQKIGLQPIQRAGVEYEFDIVADMDLQHRLTVSKTRCSEIDGRVVALPGADFLRPIMEWLNRGAPATHPAPIAPTPNAPAPEPAAPRRSPGVHLEAKEVYCDEATGSEIYRVIGELGWPEEKLSGTLAQQGYQVLTDVPLARAKELLGLLLDKLLQQEGEAAF